MSVIGKIHRKQTKQGEVLEGYLNTLKHSFRFRLMPLPKTQSSNSPTFRIATWNDAGIETDIGLAWVKEMKKSGREGEEFLTLTFDDPSFSKSLNVAAFKNPDTGDFDITFRRRQERAA